MGEAETHTLGEKLAGQIADAIVSGEMPPGYRLDETRLAQRYGVSRTPVREALRQLGPTGLIEMRPRRSAVVAQVTAEQLDTLFVAVGEMEASCTRLAALSMTPTERRRLEALHERMGDLVRAGDMAGYTDANDAFHALIYAGTHNPVLIELMTGLRRRLSPFRRAQFRTAGRLARSHQEHDTVVKAILSGDAVAGHANMVHHVSLVEDAFEQFRAGTAV
jgi:DNA-binding GntR family transcriptional regulator